MAAQVSLEMRIFPRKLLGEIPIVENRRESISGPHRSNRLCLAVCDGKYRAECLLPAVFTNESAALRESDSYALLWVKVNKEEQLGKGTFATFCAKAQETPRPRRLGHGLETRLFSVCAAGESAVVLWPVPFLLTTRQTPAQCRLSRPPCRSRRARPRLAGETCTERAAVAAPPGAPSSSSSSSSPSQSSSLPSGAARARLSGRAGAGSSRGRPDH